MGCTRTKDSGNNKFFWDCLKIYTSLSFPSYFSRNELIRMQQHSPTYRLSVKKVKIIYVNFEIGIIRLYVVYLTIVLL